MKILLTGASGFLGKIIHKYLIEIVKVTTLGKKNSDINFDLSLGQPIINNYYNLVIHAAGKAHIVPNSDLQKKDFYQVNFEGTKNLLKSLETNLPEQFVFISTVAVYGISAGENINENEPILAKDTYGNSKIQAEKFVHEWCQKNNVVCTILRLPLVVGINPPGNLGKMINGIKKGYYFNIAGGNSKKTMVLAEDIAKHILKAAQVGGVFNLSDGYHPNFFELSNSIAIQLGKRKPFNMPLKFARLLAKFGDIIGSKAPINSDKLEKLTSTLTFDDSKARNAFGWNPTPVLKGFKIRQHA